MEAVHEKNFLKVSLNSFEDKQFDLSKQSACNSVSLLSPDIDDYPVLYPEKSFILYKWRWVNLICYCLLTLSAGSSWLCFPAVSNVIRKYYNIGIMQVNLLAIVFGFAIVILSVPFGFLLDKYGLAVVLRVASFLNAVGATVRYFGAEQTNGYMFLLLGNIFTAISVSGFLFLPGKIAASWFGQHEMGKTIAICIGFDALGTGLGFLHATRMITSSDYSSDVESNIEKFLLSQLVPAGLVFIFVLVFVRKQPRTPPNIMEHEYLNQLNRYKYIKKQKRLCKCIIEQGSETDSHSKSFSESFDDLSLSEYSDSVITLKSSIVELLRNFDFHLIIHMQGIAASVEGIFQMLLNEMLTGLYPGKEKGIGVVGFTSIFLGFVSNIAVGLIVDRTGSCKKVTFVIFLLTLLSSIAWYLLMEFIHCFVAKSVMFCILISVLSCYHTIAFTHSAQLSIPLSPSAIGVMLVLTSQIYDTISMLVATEILAHFGTEGVNLFGVVLCFVGVFLSLLIKKKKVKVGTAV